MEINIKSIRHEVELITETGKSLDLTKALISLEWEECVGELAQRASITLPNLLVDGAWLHALAKINCLIRISSFWDGGSARVFEGNIWNWHYTSATSKELSITAYDPLIRLMQSRDFFYYRPGMTTQALIGDICSNWGIPLVYRWPHGITTKKRPFAAKKPLPR
ncbi:MAG: hypothetical protein LBE35_09720 [Clostridiales bacterium]|jgi:hypothetical protein|nr:hypothetical protein [Clostridiales bacterium]